MKHPTVSLPTLLGNVQPAITVYAPLAPTVARPVLAAVLHCTESALAKKAKAWRLSVVKVGKTDNYLWAEVVEAIRKHGAPETPPARPARRRTESSASASLEDVVRANGHRVVEIEDDK